MRTSFALSSLLVCFLLVPPVSAEDPLELTVDSDGVRYFVALGTRILEVYTDVIEADPEVTEDSWRQVADLASPIADIAYGPDGQIYAAVSASPWVYRVDPDSGVAISVNCTDGNCLATDLGFNYYGDLLAVNSGGGLRVWPREVALCTVPTGSYPPFVTEFCRDSDINAECVLGDLGDLPYDCCTGPGTGTCDAISSACISAGYPYSCCTGEREGTCDQSGYLIPDSAGLGSLVANQEWYSGKMMVLRDAVPGSKKPPKSDPLPAQLLKADNPDYLTSFADFVSYTLNGTPTDLTVSQAVAFYTAGKKLWLLDLESGQSTQCASFGNESALYVNGDIGGVVYVGTANNQYYRLREVSAQWNEPETGNPYWDCTQAELKSFGKNDWDRVDFGGVTSTYSTQVYEYSADNQPADGVFFLQPDGMHNFRFTPESYTLAAEIRVTPALLQTANEAIERSEDPNDQSTDPNEELGTPFINPGQSHTWEYWIVTGFSGEEFFEFSTAVTGTNFRQATCPLPCTTESCGETSNDLCEWATLIYALPLASEIVPDPRGGRIRGGTVVYETEVFRGNSNFAVDFCDWNSPAIEIGAIPDDPEAAAAYLDAFFCGSPGVYSVTSGDTFPTKFNVAEPVPLGEEDPDYCRLDPDPPVDLRVLFSAGVAGVCVGAGFEDFVGFDEVYPVRDIMPNGEGEYVDGQSLFAKAGPKKQYQFNFNSGQVELPSDWEDRLVSDPGLAIVPPNIRTIVLINATFLEDSVADGDQQVFIAVDGVPTP